MLCLSEATVLKGMTIILSPLPAVATSLGPLREILSKEKRGSGWSPINTEEAMKER